MDKQHAQRIIQATFESPFEKEKFTHFVKNLLNQIEAAPFTYQGNYIPDAYKPFIASLERIGKYTDGEHNLDILCVQLKKETSLERARTMQRNFIAWYLNGSRGGQLKDAALVAFVAPGEADWRFSLVKMDYRFEESTSGAIKVKEEFTPARRWSFLVGSNEASHTAQSRLVHLLADDEHNPTLKHLEDAFNIESVTREFFLKYRDLFIRTKEALDQVVASDARVRADFDAKGVDSVNFAKKLLGQIVFLYFLQKKGWFGVGRDAEWGCGSKHFLRELFKGSHGAYRNFFNDILEPLFYEALRIDRRHDDDYYSRFNCKIPFLNGGLFDPLNTYDWVHTDILLPNILFSNQTKTKEGDTGDGILDVFDRYNFTVKEDEPLEKEVAIDPELLGKAYEKFNAIRPDNFEDYKAALTSGQKGAESKFNKKFGVYYTPREIVHYMCQQSLINYLHTEVIASEAKQSPIPSIADIERPIHLGEQVSENESTAIIKEQRISVGQQQSTKIKPLLPESIRQNAVLIDQKLAEITVCDPAVGSGAFPVGMMSEIVKARTALSTFLPSSPSPESGEGWGGVDDRTPYAFKRRCIEHALYGVDIDPGAVEIAKLRLWLSLVVDEDDIRNIKPLPNLDYKIVCGNSLLGVQRDLLNDHLFRELETLKPRYFNETNPTQKQNYKKQIDGLISRITNGHKEFDFEIYFSEVFHAKGGFDVAIGNPPYLSLPKVQKKESFVTFKTYENSSDLYCLFYEKSNELLRKNGILCLITSNQWLQTNYGKRLRTYFIKNLNPLKLLNFGGFRMFESATVDTNVFISQKESCQNQLWACYFKTDYMPENALEDYFEKNKILLTNLDNDKWTIAENAIISLKEKLKQKGVILRNWNVKINYGIKTGLNEAFIIDTAKKDELCRIDANCAEIMQPILRGRDVHKYTANWAGLWLITAKNGIDIPKKYNVVYEHLQRFGDQIKNRADQGENWWNLRACTYYDDFEKEKIIYPETTVRRSEFYLDRKQFYIDKTCFMITGQSLPYLNAVLSSQLMEWYLETELRLLGKRSIQYSKQYIENIPIPRISDQEQKPFEALVDRILAAKQRDPAANTRTLEAEIDRLVYALYGLTEEEIALVEGLA